MLVDIAEFGGRSDGSDTAPAWNAAVAAAASGSISGVQFDRGRYSFFTTPDRVTFDGFRVNGRSPWSTWLTRRYTPAGITDSFLHFEGRGSGLEDLCIETAPDTMNGFGLRLFCDNTTLPGGKHQIENVRIAGTIGDDGVHRGTWRVPLHIQGDARTVAPIGVRGIKLYDVEVFDGTLWLAVFWGAIVCDWYGGGAYRGGGTVNGIAVGGVNAQKNRIDADIDWASSSIVGGAMRGPGR